jgi:hypothetical protein
MLPLETAFPSAPSMHTNGVAGADAPARNNARRVDIELHRHRLPGKRV